MVMKVFMCVALVMSANVTHALVASRPHDAAAATVNAMCGRVVVIDTLETSMGSYRGHSGHEFLSNYKR